jgi:hypothetical protein
LGERPLWYNENQSIKSALPVYKAQIGYQRTIWRKLIRGISDYFLENMTAEDLQGGDIEYVTWAGEAKLLAGLQNELAELENARYQFS